MADTKHLIQRNGLWLFNWRVTKDYKDVFNGKTYVTKRLKTHSLREAKFRCTQMLAEVEEAIQEHRQEGSNINDSAALYRNNVKVLFEHSHSDLAGAYSYLTEKFEQAYFSRLEGV